MGAITLAQAQEQLSEWMKANIAVSQGQSYTIGTSNGSTTLTRANAKQILDQIKYWENKVEEIKASENRRGRNRAWRIVAKDY